LVFGNGKLGKRKELAMRRLVLAAVATLAMAVPAGAQTFYAEYGPGYGYADWAGAFAYAPTYAAYRAHGPVYRARAYRPRYRAYVYDAIPGYSSADSWDWSDGAAVFSPRRAYGYGPVLW
jgi:hypothetical protein